MGVCIYCTKRFEGSGASCEPCKDRIVEQRPGKMDIALSRLVSTQGNAGINTTAQLNNRFLAAVIDFTIINFFARRLYLLIPADSTVFYLSVSLIWFAYYALSEAVFGKTFGKFWLGIEVRNNNGRPATALHIIVRNLIRIFPLWIGVGLHMAERSISLPAGNLIQYYLLNYGWALVAVTIGLSGRNRGIHDMLASTFVVEEETPGRVRKQAAIALLLIVYIMPYLIYLFFRRFG